MKVEYVVADTFGGFVDFVQPTVKTRKEARKVAKKYRTSVAAIPGEVKIFKLTEVR